MTVCPTCDQPRTAAPAGTSLPTYLVRILGESLAKAVPSETLCSACAVSATQYVCYSHVWGSTTRVNSPITEWSVPISSQKKLQDFVSVAFNHGVQWIWVDVLCINQADLATKTTEVSKMGKYFRDCRFCFVWLEDATVAKLKGGDESAAAIASDAWFKRVWTLQEGVLPRRLMAAIPGQKTFLDTIIDTCRVYGDIGEGDLRDLSFVSNLRRSIRISTSDVILACHSRKSELHHDRVFGVLGLFFYDLGALDVDYAIDHPESMKQLYRCAIASGDFSLMVSIGSDGGKVGALSQPLNFSGSFYGWQRHGLNAKVQGDKVTLRLVEAESIGPGTAFEPDYRASVPLPSTDFHKYRLGTAVINVANSVKHNSAVRAFAVSWVKGWNNLLLMEHRGDGYSYVGCGSFVLDADQSLSPEEVVLN